MNNISQFKRLKSNDNKSSVCTLLSTPMEDLSSDPMTKCLVCQYNPEVDSCTVT